MQQQQFKVQNHSQTVCCSFWCIFFILEVQDFNEFVIIIIYYRKLACVILSEIALS